MASSRYVGLVCVIGGAVGLFLLSRKLDAIRPHFFAHYVALYGEEGHRWPIDADAIVVSPDGRMVAVWGRSPDPMLQYDPQVWDVRTRQSLPYSPRNSAFKWLESVNVAGLHQTRGGLSGVVGAKGFALRDMHTGKTVRRFQGLVMPSYPAWTFTPDGKTLWWVDEQHRILWQAME